MVAKNHLFKIKDYTLYLAWLVAVIATLGSLYFSEIREYIPCDLCWYQRIFMYPLSIVLGLAAYYNETIIRKYVLPLPIIGGCISLFHYLEEKVPNFVAIKPCTRGVPCNIPYINWLGFITIPFLALCAFIIISILLFLTNRMTEEKI